MKAPGDAAMELAWLPPSARALAALSRPQSAPVWAQVRSDPGCVLLLARIQGETSTSWAATLGSLSLLETSLQFLQNAGVPFVDWAQPAPARIITIAQRQAWLASELAARVTGCDPERAWISGLLAPLGWLALAALDSEKAAQALRELDSPTEPARWQRDAWSMDHTAFARRLARRWRLPAWLVPIVGHLGLHVRIAQHLGAEPRLFQVIQLAIALTQQRDRGLALAVGASTEELAHTLGLPNAELSGLTERALQMPGELLQGEAAWTPELLADLLRLAVERRRQDDTLAGLQGDLDHLQQALEQQCREENERLHASKLAAVAELAAGAGHEINNPLAVISGQAQYLLKQLTLAEEQLVEDPSPTLYLDSLKAKLHKSLTTIVGQAQRIHHVLTDLMQFARPTSPRQQPIALATLVRDVIASVQGVADERKVRLICTDLPADVVLAGDACQWRTVVGNVLRNAVEAAPAEGWARVRSERLETDTVELAIEDSGPGPAPALREHLFDPFFSGRSAGRGRGLGLSTAWRLARQNGGDVRFAGGGETTRFVLRLPIAELPTLAPSNGSGQAGDPVKRNGLHRGPVPEIPGRDEANDAA